MHPSACNHVPHHTPAPALHHFACAHATHATHACTTRHHPRAAMHHRHACTHSSTPLQLSLERSHLVALVNGCGCDVGCGRRRCSSSLGACMHWDAASHGRQNPPPKRGLHLLGLQQQEQGAGYVCQSGQGAAAEAAPTSVTRTLRRSQVPARNLHLEGRAADPQLVFLGQPRQVRAPDCTTQRGTQHACGGCTWWAWRMPGSPTQGRAPPPPPLLPPSPHHHAPAAARAGWQHLAPQP